MYICIHVDCRYINYLLLLLLLPTTQISLITSVVSWAIAIILVFFLFMFYYNVFIKMYLY